MCALCAASTVRREYLVRTKKKKSMEKVIDMKRIKTQSFWRHAPIKREMACPTSNTVRVSFTE